jgi:PAS domain-containing protein
MPCGPQFAVPAADHTQTASSDYLSLVASVQKPIELILARNLMASLSTPAFLVDEDGVLVFFNEAAGVLLGKRFEEVGKMGPEEWGSAFGPFDDGGNPIPFERLPLTIALRQGRPAHAEFSIRSLDGTDHEIEVSAMPILATSGARGAMAIFWPLDSKGEG